MMTAQITNCPLCYQPLEDEVGTHSRCEDQEKFDSDRGRGVKGQIAAELQTILDDEANPFRIGDIQMLIDRLNREDA